MPVPAAAIGEAFPDFKISMFDQWNNPITSKQQVSLEARFEGAVVHKRVAIDSIEPGVVKVKTIVGLSSKITRESKYLKEIQDIANFFFSWRERLVHLQ